MLINYLDELDKDKINKVPDPLLKVLSGKLPEGLKYQNFGEGICGVVSEEKKMEISGLELVLSDDMKVIGDKIHDLNILHKYAYNSQKSIELKPVTDGEMIINGNKVKIDDFLIDPRHEIQINNGKFVIVPTPMDEKTELTIGSIEYKRKLKFKRIPDNSYDIVYFKSYGDNSLSCDIRFNETTQKIKINLSYSFNNVKKVQDIVEILEIFYAFKHNKGMINDFPINISDFDEKQTFNEDTLWFWKRVRELEENMECSFDIIEGNYGDYITEELVEDIDILYRSIVQKKPVRINSKIDKLHGECKQEEEVIIAENNKEMLLRFELIYKFNLFGKIYRYPALIYVFNARYIDKEVKENKYTIFFDDKNENEKMYYSLMLFRNTNELGDYEEKNTDIVEQFKDAECKSIIKLK